MRFVVWQHLGGLRLDFSHLDTGVGVKGKTVRTLRLIFLLISERLRPRVVVSRMPKSALGRET